MVHGEVDRILDLVNEFGLEQQDKKVYNCTRQNHIIIRFDVCINIPTQHTE